jgi:hypothetical protein
MKFKCHTTIDDITLYMGRGCEIHPLLLDEYYAQLDYLQRMGKISLMPSAILEKFNRKYFRVA